MATATFTARRNQNLYRQPAQVKLGPTSATFVVIALISVLAIMYLHQITKTNTFSYKITDLKQQFDKVQAGKQEMAVEAGRLQSITATKNSSVARSMVPTGQVSYAR